MTSPYRHNLIDLVQAGRIIFAARELMGVSELVSQKRYLSKEETGRTGQWSNDYVPFAEEIMDACTDKNVERITGMFSAQVCKTEIMKNFIFWVIAENPAMMLMIYPSDGDARDFSSEKLETMISNNPVIRDKVSPAKRNSKDNKTLYKKFIGGFLAIAGAKVPQSLARRSVMYVLADDRDRITQAGTEGDAVELAWQRTESFALLGRKLIEFSTPTIEGQSAIYRAYLASDQREYYVPCPFCGHEQTLQFENLIWEKELDEQGEPIKHFSETVKYKCEKCEQLIDESYKYNMLHSGKWTAKYPDRTKHRGYWLNRLYSQFSTWKDIVEYFLRVKDDRTEYQVFWNTVLARLWKQEEYEEIPSSALAERCENYLIGNDPRIPNEVLVLTLAVDTQPDRLEYQVIGWGLQFEPWLLEYGQLYGDADQEDVYNALEVIQNEIWKREDGVELKIYARPGIDFPIFIDSGGSNTQSVYRECKKREGRGWMALKGIGGGDKSIVMNVSPVGVKKDIRLQIIGVDAAKSWLHKMLRQDKSPNKIHIPLKFSSDDYFEQLTSERYIKELDKKRNRWRWIWKKKTADARNEVSDIWGYAYACILKLNPNFVTIKARLEERAKTLKGNTDQIQKQPEVRTIKLTRSSINRRDNNRVRRRM